MNTIPDFTVNETELVSIIPFLSYIENDSLNFTFSPPSIPQACGRPLYEDAGEYTARATVSDGFSNVSRMLRSQCSM